MQVFKPFFINFILLGLLWSRRASPSACGDRRAGQGGGPPLHYSYVKHVSLSMSYRVSRGAILWAAQRIAPGRLYDSSWRPGG